MRTRERQPRVQRSQHITRPTRVRGTLLDPVLTCCAFVHPPLQALEQRRRGDRVDVERLEELKDRVGGHHRRGRGGRQGGPDCR